MQLTSFGNRLYNLFAEHKRKFLYIPLSTYWLILFILTSIPGRALPKVVLIFTDKAKHLIAYLILSFLLNFAIHFQKKYLKLNKHSGISTLIIIAIYGIFDEIHQIFIPGRYFEWLDFLSDLIGGIIGILAAQWIIEQNRKSELNRELL